MNWLIIDLDLYKMDDVFISDETMEEFYDNYICKHPNKGILLQNFSNLYIFKASICNSSKEKSWKDILNEEQYKLLEQNNEYILGYILINKRVEKNNIQYIDFIDTRLPKYNLATEMIIKYQEITGFNLYPLQIIESSAKYWKNIYHLYTFEQLNEMIEEEGLNKKVIRWKYLEDLLTKDPVSDY